MKRRFPPQQLYELRNLIPIDGLIEKHLMIPSKISEGFFRFLCPLCGKFQTAVNPKTNLARCFSCEKNFNTIDLVMMEKNKNFVESVKYLEACLNGLTPKWSKQSVPLAPGRNNAVSSMGEILKNLPLKTG